MKVTRVQNQKHHVISPACDSENKKQECRSKGTEDWSCGVGAGEEGSRSKQREGQGSAESLRRTQFQYTAQRRQLTKL